MMNDSFLKIGAKQLGALMLPKFCPRCFWYRMHAGNPPFSSFPSIFNEIDLYTKRLVEALIHRDQKAPEWMGSSFAEAVAYENVGFLQWKDPKNSILLRGSPDMVLHDGDALWFVADYKTARYSKGQDTFLAQYKVQLLAYAFLLEKNGYNRPERAALLYFGPPAKPTAKELLSRAEQTGFALPLSVEVVGIDLGDNKLIQKLLDQVREIYDAEEAPEGLEECRDCLRIDAYHRQAKKDSRKDPVLRVDSFRMWGQQQRVTVWDTSAHDAIMALDNGEWFPEWAGN
jgi:CRISPR/Cas system-associated exonuclease Cas4 (RecB family)